MRTKIKAILLALALTLGLTGVGVAAASSAGAATVGSCATAARPFRYLGGIYSQIVNTNCGFQRTNIGLCLERYDAASSSWQNDNGPGYCGTQSVLMPMYCTSGPYTWFRATLIVDNNGVWLVQSQTYSNTECA